MRNVVIGFVMVLLLLVPFLASCMVVSPPIVENLPLADFSRTEEVFSKYAGTPMPPGWEPGLVIQKTWERIAGLRGDPYNNVRFIVLLSDGRAWSFHPYTGNQEAWFVENVDVGDFIGFKLDLEPILGNGSNSPRQALKMQEIMFIGSIKD